MEEPQADAFRAAENQIVCMFDVQVGLLYRKVRSAGLATSGSKEGRGECCPVISLVSAFDISGMEGQVKV